MLRSLIYTIVASTFLWNCSTSTQENQLEVQEDISSENVAIPSSGFIDVSDSLSLYYTIRGNGPDTVVMIHGGPGMDAGYMINDFDEMEQKHVLIYYDQRGGGRSGLPDTTRAEELLSIDKHVEDLETLRKFFDLSKMNLLAHSFGPAIAINYAFTYSQNIEKMIFIGPIPPYVGDFFSRYAESLTERLTEDELQALDSLEKEMITGKNTVEACRAYWQIGLKPRIAADLSVDVVKGDCCSASAEGIQYGYKFTGNHTFASLGNWDYRSQLNDVTMPVLILHGTEESIPMDMVEEWDQYLPNSTFHKIENAAHFPYAERPEQVWPLIEEFFNNQ